MIVTCEDAPLELPPPKIARSVGIHQSAIIRCVAMDYGLLKPEWCEELSLHDFRQVTNRTAILRMCLGLAWEEWYIPQLPDVVDHPEEIKYEGVYMSMDGESLTVVFSQYNSRRMVAPIVHEVKVTWKSLNTVGLLDTPERLRKNWIWLAQLKTYCIAKKTRFARLHSYFVCGDYKRPIQPQLKVYNFEFTDEELNENWTFLTDYLKHRLDLEKL